jgi:gamma-glutamylcyclotransferase (GGCT)/AIG2-like uncharacterized protein YtfP
MPLVFQYGSNTSKRRLNGPDRLAGKAAPLGLAVTSADAYALAFTHRTRLGHAAADLIEGNRAVFGALYEVPPDRLYRTRKVGSAKTLDEIEGEGVSYRRTVISVRRADSGAVVTAETYVVINKLEGLAASAEYVEHIVTGLREFNAPPDYVEYVKLVAAASSPLERAAIMAL